MLFPHPPGRHALPLVHAPARLFHLHALHCSLICCALFDGWLPANGVRRKVLKQNTKNAAKRKQQAAMAQRAAEKPAPAAKKGAKKGEETVFHDVDTANDAS